MQFKKVTVVSFWKFSALIDVLNAPGKLPGSAGCRNLNDVISDLRAQVASNNKGIALVCELIDFYGLEVVQSYMGHIQSNAEVAVRDLLKQVAKETKRKTGSTKLHAIDYMDDGTPLELHVQIDEKKVNY